MSIPVEVRRNLMRWQYADYAFSHCKAACDYIIEEELTEKDSVYYPLNIAAVVCYGRPFKRQRGLEVVCEKLVPEGYTELHRELLGLRDKVYAHVDAERSEMPSGKLAVELLYVATPKGVGICAFEVPMGREEISRLSKLCVVLLAKTQYHIRKLWCAHKRHFPKGCGQFRIGTLEDEPGFTKVEREL